MQPGKYLKYKLVEKMRKRSGSGSGILIFSYHVSSSLLGGGVLLLQALL